jgi:hypothetical protein
MMISRGLISYTGYPHTIGNADLVDLLELGSEQTIEGVLKTNIWRNTPPSHGDGHASQTV